MEIFRKTAFGIVLAAIVVISVFFIQTSSKNRPIAPVVEQQVEGTTTSADIMPRATATTTDAEWRKILTPAQYNILREAGTEVPFTGALEYENRKGTYYSYGCDKPLFRSEQKFDSGTGWPSCWAPISSSSVVTKEDDSL
jgi:hypothetical protein